MEIVWQYKKRTENVITLEALEDARKQKLERRRQKRHARRIYKRFPLFATEFVQERYPNYTEAQLQEDIKGLKPKKKKKGKSQLKRMGRYPLYAKLMRDYYFSKDVETLKKAQDIRDRLFKRYEMVFGLGKGRGTVTYSFPATYNYKIIEEASKIKGYKTQQELEVMLDEVMKYARFR